MEKKTIYYIIGGIAILGIGYYLMNKGKKTTNDKEIDSDSMALDSIALDSGKADLGKKQNLTETGLPILESTVKKIGKADTSPSGYSTAIKEGVSTQSTTLETKKAKRKACGIEPKLATGFLTGGVAMINFRKRKAKWQACVDSGGIASFEGNSNAFNNQYFEIEDRLTDL